MPKNRTLVSANAQLAPEEYVTALYRVLLKREPDDEGLRHHSGGLRKHGDHSKVFADFVNSDEYREVELAQRKAAAGNWGLSKPKFADNRLNLDTLIASSHAHFQDVSFFKSLAGRSKQFGRIKRKIETVAVYYPKMSNGGTERVTSRQILAWRQLGYRVILITDQPKDPKHDYDYGDVPRFIIPPKMMENNDYRSRGLALAQILREEDVDVFVNNLWDETSTGWDLLVAKLLGIPTVIGWHNIFDTRIRSEHDIALANFRFTAYKYADLVTVLSTVDKLWFTSRGVTSRVVYNPLTFDALPEKTASLDGKTIVWIARAERHQKRLDLAIQMFPLVLERVPDARLLIVGGGPDLAWAKEYAEALGIEDSVEFTGYTTDVAKYLARADIHILTSEFEGWCLALGEVWAYGIPTVMFDLPYLEYVQSGKGYVAVEMLDIHGMANAVSELLLDSNRRKKMGREAREVLEVFDQVDVTQVWHQIFKDIETLDDLSTPTSKEDELRGLRALSTVLGNRLLSFGDHHKPRHYTPVLPSQAPIQPPHTEYGRKALRIVQQAAAPYERFKSALETRLLPDKRLRMIDLSHVGLGDNLMLWSGLFTLLSNQVDICAPGCVMHVQPILVDLATRFFARFGLIIQRGRPQQHISPLFTPLPPENWKEWWGTYIGRDWRMNWVEALDQQKTFPRNGADLSFAGRMRLAVSERILYRRNSWAEATPGYIGYRVWLPLALKNGVYPLTFLSQIKRSLVEMRDIFANFVDESTHADVRRHYQGNAAFPTGKSFQTIPPTFYSAINDALGGNFFTCYIQNDSPWWPQYEVNGVEAKSLPNLMETFRIIKYANNLLTTDSFTSHIAQFLRDDFVLVLSRDMKEGILHPGANPTVMANHPACAPCNYQERYHFDRCVAGYEYCTAFQSPVLLDSIIKHFRG